MNVFNKNIKSVAALFLLLLAKPLLAEDIDLFLGLPATSADAPNVLFVIDNTANWSQTSAVTGQPIWDSEQTALANIFQALDPNAVNVGIMLFTETGGSNDNVDGGYIRSAIRFMNSTNKELYRQQILSFDENDDKSNGGKAGLAMQEAYLYFSGGSVDAGNDKQKTDYTNNPDGIDPPTTVTERVTDGDICGFKGNGQPRTCDVTTTTPGGPNADGAVWSLPGNALDTKSDSTYNSPIPGGYCGKNYIIFISNGAAQDNTSDIRRGEATLSGLGGDISQISITPSGSANNPADEWARFMAGSPEAITTFTIDVDKVTNGQGPGWTALLKSMADESGGTYYDVDSGVAGISGAVNDAFSRILAVNSVFASVALPASANTQSTFINQIYIGLFRPDEQAKPRWFGNMKQYKFAFDASTGDEVLRVVDAGESAIIDSGTGFVRECARSFWTPSSTDSYWSYLPDNERRGECTDVANSEVSNYPDGPIVEKGGQAYMGRGGASFGSAVASGRTVKTMADSLCGTGATPTSCAAMSNFADTNSALGALGSNKINWARGADILDEDGDSDFGEYRPSLHGDVIHSQPVAIDYAADPNNPNVVVFYGANDGMLRAINGNRTTSHNSKAAGNEFWAFMPPDYYDDIQQNYDNSPIINFPATTNGSTAGSGKGYGPDGPLTAYDDEVSTRELYMGLRRGGRSIYGFNVSTVNSPSVMWRLGCDTPLGDNTGCASSSDWDDIGQTWSPMNQVTVQGDSTRYLIMGGGYDTCEDYDDPNTPANHSCGAGTDGDVIYVFNATSGEVVKEFDAEIERAVPGAVTVVTVSDNDPSIKYAYAADMGGNVYRISGETAGGDPDVIGTTAPADWIITKIADLGCGTTSTATCTANRKFLYGPDVVRIPNGSDVAAEYGIFVGSGEREKPLADYGAAASVQNYFFGIYDSPSVASWLTSESSTCGANSICLDSLTVVDPNGPLDPSAASGKGWAASMRSGEQVVSGSLIVADIVNFSTHIPVQPDATACSSDLGTATTYNIGYESGSGDLIPITGGGLVPTPVAGKVTLDNGQTVPFCIGCGGEESAIGGSQVTSGISWSQPKSRIYWNIEK